MLKSNKFIIMTLIVQIYIKRGIQMAKIIKVELGEVFILMDDQQIVKIEEYTMDFEPKVNDQVDVYQYEDTYIVNKLAAVSTNRVSVPDWGGRVKVNKLAYAILAIFLGGFGIHKFYAKKIGSGILYLLFSWTTIPVFVGFIEGIIALTKEEIEEGIILV